MKLGKGYNIHLFETTQSWIVSNGNNGEDYFFRWVSVDISVSLFREWWG